MSDTEKDEGMICIGCRRPIVAGERYVDIEAHRLVALKTKTKVVDDGLVGVWHDTCFKMATKSPDIDLKELERVALASRS